ncbi:MAG: hypothetical protein U0W24_26465 [Bacteroidales bacterium]
MTNKAFKLTATLFLLTLLITGVSAQKARPKAIRWNIPGVPYPGLSNIQVSGQQVLYLPQINKNKEAIYWFAERPYSPGQSFVDSTDSKKLAASILGRIVSMEKDGDYVENPSPCSTGINSPFTVSDVERSTEYGTGYKFTIKKNKIKNLNTSINVEADLKKLIGVEKVSDLLIDSLRAVLTTGYSRLNDIEVKIIGTYEVYRLSDDVIVKLSRPGQGYFSDCQSYLSNRKSNGNNEGIITSIGFVTYDVEYSQNKADSLIFNINAILSRNGLIVNPKLFINYRVRTNIDASINRGYQVLVWKKVPLDGMRRE